MYTESKALPSAWAREEGWGMGAVLNSSNVTIINLPLQ